MDAASRRKGLLAELLWLLAFVPLSIAFTWPLAARFTTALAGERDAWQSLWTIVWLNRSLFAGHNPFFTHDLWHPDGVTLLFEALDLPDTVWAAAIVRWMGYWPTYNLAVLWTFIASGAAMYALGRGTGASRPAAFLSGCAYTFCTYHFCHTLAHLTLISIQWLPLYALAFWRILETRSLQWAVAGGVFLGLTALASWYYVLALFLFSAGLVLAWLVRNRGRGVGGFLLRGALLCAVFLVLIGPLGLVMMKHRASEPLTGAHPANFYSADVQSFYLPNAAQELSRWSQSYRAWTGNAGEAGEYLGTIMIVLVFAGAILGAPRTRAYVLASIIGVVFSLGPTLHVAGKTIPTDPLPYAWLARAVPLLDFMGVPMRLSFVASLALAAALAPALDTLHRHISWRWLAPLAVLGVLEHTPHPLVMTALPTPEPMLEWARDPTPFAVLDTGPDTEHIEWHQILHAHPTFAVWVNRTPENLIRKLERDPVAGPLYFAHGAGQLRISREAALRHLSDLRVRYVVQPTSDPRGITELQLGLRPMYEGAGVRIYEVPPS